MLRFPFLGSGARSASRGTRAIGALFAALLVSSCLTPDMQFGEDPATRTGGTTGDTGGNGPTESGGGTPSTTGGSGQGGEGGTVIPPVEHCVNGVQDEDETDRNCGGDDCPNCANGKKCEIDGDCVVDSCVMGRCQEPECTDDVENGDETDVDCGAPASGCGPCDDGDSCTRGDGCLSGVCKSGKCAVPTCTDNVKNGEETDVDCGGNCTLCDVGKACVSSDDCKQPPTIEGSEAFVTCEELVCVITCDTFTGDCNERVSDGCETSLLTSAAHCGACRDACAPDNAMGECVAGNCLIDTDAPDTTEGCLGSFANCNGEAEDGCEADLDNDPETCGSCDFKCSSQNGTPDCDARVCSIDCDSGFDDCNSDASDGCEADLTVSTLHCTECFNACSATPPQVPVCDGTQCLGITCDAPSDCGGVQPCGACDQDSPDPLCNDALNTTTHCGGCGIDCTAANATTVCVENSGYSCAIDDCTGAYADCDEDYLNGCEIETDTNRNHCGDCLAGDPAGGSGENCDLTKGAQVAQTSCSGGACKVLSCNSGFADCDGDWSNGCEVDLNDNDAHCGGCTSGPTSTWDGGANCDNVFPNASGVCTAGQCELSNCDGNYESCDGVAANGCETLAQGDPGNCGGCGNLSSQYICATNGGTSANTCSGSATTCTPTCVNNAGTTGADFGNCDGENWDGCEQGLQSSLSHCGACGNNCTTGMHTSGASATCSSASCAIATCDPNLADCNGTWSDGCEVNFSNTNTSCGGCTAGPTTAWDAGAVNCSSSVGTNNITSTQCASSACSVTGCGAGRADCNGTFSDGCEINTSTSATHCGGCSSGPTTSWDGGTDCTGTMHSSGASAQCVSGTSCAIATCDAGLADCNGTWSDGCEINTTNNVTHCGGCQSGPTTAWDAGETCTDKPNATVSGCVSGACTYTCASGWSNTNGSWTDGCEARTITLVNSSDPSNTGTYFKDTGGSATLTFSHTLATAAGNHRAVLVAYLCRGNSAAICTPSITYGSTAMTAIGTTVGNQSYANIYYLLDSSLPAPGTYTVTVNPTDDWSGFAVQILELSGVEQSTFYAGFGGATGGNCGTTALPADVTYSLTGLPTGSRVYAIAGGFTSGTVSVVAQSPLSLLGTPGTNANPTALGMGAGWTSSTVTGTQSAAFALSTCNSSAMMAVGIRPEANY